MVGVYSWALSVTDRPALTVLAKPWGIQMIGDWILVSISTLAGSDLGRAFRLSGWHRSCTTAARCICLSDCLRLWLISQTSITMTSQLHIEIPRSPSGYSQDTVGQSCRAKLTHSCFHCCFQIHGKGCASLQNHRRAEAGPYSGEKHIKTRASAP